MITPDVVLNAVNRSADSACNALLALYARQTADEQAAGQTAHHNGQGFNGLDAGILSSFAEQVLRNRAARTAGQVTYDFDLSVKQLALLRKKLPKYMRQLIEIAEEKAAARTARSQVQVDAKLPEVNGFDVPQEMRIDLVNSGPSTLVQTESGWRFKTAKEFAADTNTRHGIKLPEGLGTVISSVGLIGEYDEFELAINGLTG